MLCWIRIDLSMKMREISRAVDKKLQVNNNQCINFAFINSIKCLTPSEEFEKEMGKSTVGLQARFVSKMLRKLTAILASEEVGLVLVNHLTTKIGGFNPMGGESLTSACGRAIRYSSLLTLDLRRSFIKSEDPVDSDKAIKVGVTIKKNHCNPYGNPYMKTEYYAIFGVGTDVDSEILDSAVNQGIIIKSGAWIREPDPNDNTKSRVFEDGTEARWNGKNKFREYLNNNPNYRDYLMSLITGGSTTGLTAEEVEQLKLEEEKDVDPLNEELEDKIDEFLEKHSTKRKKKIKDNENKQEQIEEKDIKIDNNQENEENEAQ